MGSDKITARHQANLSADRKAIDRLRGSLKGPVEGGFRIAPMLMKEELERIVADNAGNMPPAPEDREQHKLSVSLDHEWLKKLNKKAASLGYKNHGGKYSPALKLLRALVNREYGGES